MEAIVRSIQRSTCWFRLAGTVVGTIALAGMCATRLLPQSTPPVSQSPTNRAVFANGGNVRLPAGYRKWEHVGTRIKADGFSVLDGSRITVPQVMDAYVEPSAYDFFRKTGKWRDGTQIVKEYSLVKTGPECSTTSFVCATVFGRGVFEDHYAGLGMMIKDKKRFPTAAGNWGYFTFLPAGHIYQLSARARPRQQCSLCHENGAGETDYVFSKSHIGLLAANTQ